MIFPIVSYLTDSTKEFDGEFSLVMFCYGCNMKCIGCYNAKMVLDKSNIIGDGFEMMDELIDPLTTAVVLLGGEPTVHSQIDMVLRKARAKGLKTKIFTNGYETDHVIRLLDSQLLDEISVDFKAMKDVSGLIRVDMSDEEYMDRLNRIVETASRNGTKVKLHSTMFPSIAHQEAEIVNHVVKNWLNTEHVIQKFFEPSSCGVE